MLKAEILERNTPRSENPTTLGTLLDEGRLTTGLTFCHTHLGEYTYGTRRNREFTYRLSDGTEGTAELRLHLRDIYIRKYC